MKCIVKEERWFYERIMRQYFVIRNNEELLKWRIEEFIYNTYKIGGSFKKTVHTSNNSKIDDRFMHNNSVIVKNRRRIMC